MIIKGVGTFMAKRYAKDGKGAEVITLGSLQDLRITLNTEIDDIFGGDGLFAIDTLVRSKSIEITATDAKFDLDAIQLMMGSTVREEVNDYVWVLREQKELALGTNGTQAVTTATPVFGTTIYTADPGFTVRLKNNNKLLTQIAYVVDTEPDADEFMWDATAKKLYLNTAHANSDIEMNYKRTETVDIVDILVDEVPFPVHVIHHGSFLQKDNTFGGVETELYSCRAQGSFNINAARASASSSEISLKVLDPERADGKLGTIKRFNTATKA